MNGGRPHGRTRRRVLRGLVGAVTVLWVLQPVLVPAQESTSDPVTVTALESFESQPMLTAMSRLMTGGSRSVSIDDRPEGTGEAREEFIAGASDFVVSGVGFTDAQKAALRTAGRDVIGAPVQAVGLPIFGFAPQLPIFPARCAPTETVEDPGCTFFDSSRYAGPVRLTPAVLADLMYERSNIWTLPELQQSLDIPQDGTFLLPPINGPRPLVRNDLDATNLYLDRYLALTAGDVRAAVLAAIPGADASASTETWPNPLTPSRTGENNVVAQISEGLDPGASLRSEGGSVGGASASAVQGAFDTNATRPPDQQTGLFRVQLRNAAGEWVAATPDSITAALAATGGAPMGGATNPVPGAYPITWVNRLYAPSTGLTADEANVVATIIRLQVTTGQGDIARFLGDGRLPKALVDEALDAADRIVTSNCEAAKGSVYTSDDLGPFTPSGTTGGLGKVKLCKAVPSAAGEDTSVAGEDALGSYDSGSYGDSGYYGDSGTYADSPLFDSSGGYDGSSGTGSSSSSAAAARRAQAIAAQSFMPLPIPGQSLSPLDRAVTLALGAAAFLVVRRAWMRRQAAV